MTAQPNQPLHAVPTLTDDVHRYLTLKDAKATIDTELAAIKARLATTVGTGNTTDVGDVTVSVRPPNRRFNPTKALELLDEATVDACRKVDAALVKKHLTPLQLDECMDEGTGDPIVEVK